MGSPRLKALVLTNGERLQLLAWAGRRRTAQGLAQRARIVLAAREGGSCPAIGERLGMHADTVRKWWHRFAQHRLEGLRDEPRPGAPRRIEDARIEGLISKTLESLPTDGTHWSSRRNGPRQRLIGLHGAAYLARLRAAATSRGDIRDVVGLYMAPPDRAVVLCVDEKSQIQGACQESCVEGHTSSP